MRRELAGALHQERQQSELGRREAHLDPLQVGLVVVDVDDELTVTQ